MTTELIFGKDKQVDVQLPNKKIVSEIFNINPGMTLNLSCETTQDILMKVISDNGEVEINGKHTTVPNDTNEPISVHFEISGPNDVELPIDTYTFNSTFDGLPLVVEYLFSVSGTYFIRKNEFTQRLGYEKAFPRYSLDGENFIDFVPNENGECEVTVNAGDRLTIESHPHSLYRVEGLNTQPLGSDNPWSKLFTSSPTTTNFLNEEFSFTSSFMSSTTTTSTYTTTSTHTTTSTTTGGETSTYMTTSTFTSATRNYLVLGKVGVVRNGISEIKVMKWGDTLDLTGQFGYYEITKFYEDVNVDTNKGIKFEGAWAHNVKLVDFQISYMPFALNISSAWKGCSSLTSFPLIDTSKCTNFKNSWSRCSSLTSFPLIDTSNGTNFGYAWAFCSSLPSCPGTDGTVTIPTGAYTSEMCNGI